MMEEVVKNNLPALSGWLVTTRYHNRHMLAKEDPVS